MDSQLKGLLSSLLYGITSWKVSINSFVSNQKSIYLAGKLKNHTN